MTTPLTLFSFGYHGWGPSTDKLIQAIDAVEESRGYAPPFFVDVRYERIVRATGFNGDAFARRIGSQRHEWMKGLGNEGVKDPYGPPIRISKPEMAEDLLTKAQILATENRRLLFFCHCPVPDVCHRTTVAELVQSAARRRGVATQIVEWPGGQPETAGLHVPDGIWRKLKQRRGREEGLKNIPFGPDMPDLGWLRLPWGSVLHAQLNTKDSLAVVSGPAYYTRGKWQLPVWAVFDDMYGEWEKAVAEGRIRRGVDGYDLRSSDSQ